MNTETQSTELPHRVIVSADEAARRTGLAHTGEGLLQQFPQARTHPGGDTVNLSFFLTYSARAVKPDTSQAA